MLRRVFQRLGAVLFGLLAVEGILLVLTYDGALLGEPLPPYAAVNSERQSNWVERLRSEEPFQLARFDADLGWEWKPGASNDDGSISLNRWGARGQREYEPTPPAGQTRLMFFGDSYTFCDEMPDNSSFQHYLELRRPELEAVNFGVNGYGTDQALLRYRRLGPDRGARVVFIGILIENIGRNANRLRPLWNPKSGFAFPKPRFVLRDGELTLVPQPFADRSALVAAFDDGSLIEQIAADEYWLRQPDLGGWAWSRSARLMALPLAHRARDPLALWNDPEGEPRQVTLAILEQFQREAIADGAERAPILVFPSREDLAEMQAGGTERWNAVGALLRERGLEFIDLAPALLERKLALDADPSLGTLHFRGHHSSVGNDVVALEIERWLVEQRILSATDEPNALPPPSSMNSNPTPLNPAIVAALAPPTDGTVDLNAALLAILLELKAESGTIHFLGADGFLHLAANGPGMPPQVLEVIQRIPVGKGMAGLAAERAEPVTICNLQTDDSGDARPGAKATGLEGSIVVPIFDASHKTIGTLGVANRSPRTFTDEETRTLLTIGRALALVKR